MAFIKCSGGGGSKVSFGEYNGTITRTVWEINVGFRPKLIYVGARNASGSIYENGARLASFYCEDIDTTKVLFTNGVNTGGSTVYTLPSTGNTYINSITDTGFTHGYYNQYPSYFYYCLKY